MPLSSSLMLKHLVERCRVCGHAAWQRAVGSQLQLHVLSEHMFKCNMWVPCSSSSHVVATCSSRSATLADLRGMLMDQQRGMSC